MTNHSETYESKRFLVWISKHKDDWENLFIEDIEPGPSLKRYQKLLEKLYEEGFYTVVITLLTLGKMGCFAEILIDQAMLKNLARTWDEKSLGEVVSTICESE